MSDVEKLSDIARRCLGQDNIEEKNNQIDFIKTRLMQKGGWLSWLDYPCWGAGLTSLVLATRYGVPAPTTLTFIPDLALAAMGMGLIYWAIRGKRRFQNRKKWLTTDRQYSADIPPELAQLLNDLSEERIVPFEADEREYLPGTVKRASDETPIRTWPPKKLFANRYAPLLLSSDTKAYSYVWPLAPFERTVEGTLYVDWTLQKNKHHWCRPISKPESEIQPLEIATVQSTSSDCEAPEPAQNPSICSNSESQSEITSPEMAVGQSTSPVSEASTPLLNPPIEKNEESSNIDDEEPNHNEKPEHQWLVGRKRWEFEKSLSRFLAEKIPGHRREWYRVVLTIGRRELRRGGQRTSQSHAVEVIEQELKKNFGTIAMPGASESATATIKKIIQGKYIEGMREYFSSPSPTDPM